ncbi:hypothetical protein ES332_A02G079300v1 [Gossypium tomentosum]|uniref:Uncharacterized protein n=1 Tax=Gossypium tomentosum TaxID=34277 RepID=A0A5D2RGC6_GOSTO|nr:hypothetical protein ES332_A02G079300v1 [Gossypium tomentosum]
MEKRPLTSTLEHPRRLSPQSRKRKKERITSAPFGSGGRDEGEPFAGTITALPRWSDTRGGPTAAVSEACAEGAWWLGVADEEATRGMRLLGFLLLISAENANVVWARFLIFGPICDWVIIFTRPANLGFYNIYINLQVGY